MAQRGGGDGGGGGGGVGVEEKRGLISTLNHSTDSGKGVRWKLRSPLIFSLYEHQLMI